MGDTGDTTIDITGGEYYLLQDNIYYRGDTGESTREYGEERNRGKRGVAEDRWDGSLLYHT
jgi:hypothetical protein